MWKMSRKLFSTYHTKLCLLSKGVDLRKFSIYYKIILFLSFQNKPEALTVEKNVFFSKLSKNGNFF